MSTRDQKTTPRRVVVIVAAALIAAACASAPNTTAPRPTEEAGRVETTTSSSTTPTSISPPSPDAPTSTTADAGRRVVREQQTFFQDMFEVLPTHYRDAPISRVTATAYELAAVDSAVAPFADAASTDEAIERLIDLANWQSVDQGGNGFALLRSNPFPTGSMFGDHEAVADELGLDLFAVRGVASVSSDGRMFATLDGDLDISESLVERRPGVRSTGDWPDGDLNMGDATPARPFGQTLHLTSREAASSELLVGVGHDLDVVSAWRDGSSESLAELDSYATLARTLDAEFVTSVDAEEADFRVTEPTIDPESLIAEAFRLRAFGTSIHGGSARTVVVYVFADESSAARALPQVEQVWNETESMVTRDVIRSKFGTPVFSQRQSAVVVSIDVPDDRIADQIEIHFVTNDVIAIHR